MSQEVSASPAIVAFAQRAEAFVDLVEQGHFESTSDRNAERRDLTRWAGPGTVHLTLRHELLITGLDRA